MCFAKVPPEINSGRMFFGAGSASLQRAATTWDGLASGLRQTAVDCQAVSATLGRGRHGARAAATTRAMTPYIAWLYAAADSAAQAATQASAAVHAHDLALAAMVHPDDVVINRVRLTTLCGSNHLACDSPAIADAEAEYDRMWTQDAEAMYSYARASAKAATLTPFGSTIADVPGTRATSPDVNVRRRARILAATPDVVATGQPVMAAIQSALHELSSSPEATMDTYLLPATAALSKLGSLAGASEVAIKNLNTVNRGMMLLKAAAMTAPEGSPVVAGLGRRVTVGRLSVPPRWLSETETEPEFDDTWLPVPLRLVDHSPRARSGE